jgi:hypothetical protein
MQNINIELQQKNIGSITHTKKIENNSKLEAHLCLYSLSGNTLSVYYLLTNVLVNQGCAFWQEDISYWISPMIYHPKITDVQFKFNEVAVVR